METHKSSQLEFLTKSTSRRTRKEDQVRLRALNGLLYKALTDLLCTPEVSQELCDLNVELCKVTMGPRTPSGASRLGEAGGRLGVCLEVSGGRRGGQAQIVPGVLPGVRRAIRGRPGSGEWWPVCLPLRVRTGSWLLPSSPSRWSGFTQGRQRALRHFWGGAGAGVRSGHGGGEGLGPWHWCWCWGRSQDCPWVSAYLLTPSVHESPGELTVIWGGGRGLRSL